MKERSQTHLDVLGGECLLTQHRERLEFRHIRLAIEGKLEQHSQVPRLTFLLSSISCSNMALNTGERAETERDTEDREREKERERGGVCYCV